MAEYTLTCVEAKGFTFDYSAAIHKAVNTPNAIYITITDEICGFAVRLVGKSVQF